MIFNSITIFPVVKLTCNVISLINGQVDPPKTRALEWLSYIQPARNEDEQNMEAYMKNGRVFLQNIKNCES